MNKSQSKYLNTAQKMDEAFISLLGHKDFEYITVKDICSAAGVNRSTFYLHYENIGDMLDEVSEYISNKFFSRFDESLNASVLNVETCRLEELVFMRQDVLVPYLNFIKENRALFKICIKHPQVVGTNVIFETMFSRALSPIMRRFRYKEEYHRYFASFYLSGMTAIVFEWLRADCREPVEVIAEIMKKCALPDGNGILSMKKAADLFEDGNKEDIRNKK